MVKQQITEVSIVIVCMNNLENLYPCLNSIKAHTSVIYETLVVAYLFSNENLQKLKNDYPWISIIESNEIKGFSENNNIALRQAKGEYCFIVNDDTFINSNVIDNLIHDFRKLPNDVAIVSPNIKYPDDTPQCCGRPYMDWKHYVLLCLKLWSEKQYNLKCNYKSQLFQTYNILGAAFMIRTKIFKQIGYFDERYFFSPEDIDVSRKINRLGFKCFVDPKQTVYHVGGGTTWSPIVEATRPAGAIGAKLFFGDDSKIKTFIVCLIVFITKGLTSIYYKIRSINGDKVYITKSRAFKNVAFNIFRDISAKEVFIKYYNRLKTNEKGN